MCKSQGRAGVERVREPEQMMRRVLLGQGVGDAGEAGIVC